MPVPSYPGRSRYNEIYFVSQGHIVREMNLRTIQINPNELHLSLEEQITSVHSFGGDVRGFYCCFNTAFLEQLLLKNDAARDLVFINSFMYHYPLRLTKSTGERIARALHTLCEIAEDSSVSSALPVSYLQTILLELKEILLVIEQSSPSSKPFLITKQYHDLLVRHITSHREIEFYASLLGITPNHLNKSVKTATGETAVELRNKMSLLESKLLLKQSSLSIAEIAYQLGFCEPAYFSRFFKKTTGVSPLQYREA